MLRTEHRDGGETESPQDAGQDIVLLVVDDERLVRWAIDRILSRYFCVITVDSGPKALEIAKRRNQQIDVLLTDVCMPDMNGAELGKQMQVIRPEVAQIYMSGGLKDVMLEPSATLVPKPLDFPALIELVRERVATSPFE